MKIDTSIILSLAAFSCLGRILMSVGQEQHVIRFYVDPGAVCLLTLPELGVGRLVCLGVGKVERLPLRPVAR